MDRIKQAGVRPDLTMINTAVKACCLAGAMEEAEELVESMKVCYRRAFGFVASPETRQDWFCLFYDVCM